MERPGRLTAIGIMQIVSGVLQFPMACLVSMTVGTIVGTIAGIVTLGFGTICGVVGIVGYLLIPIGILEIVSGIVTLTNASNRSLTRTTAYVEIGSILAGGLPALIVGIVSLMMLGDQQVQDWYATRQLEAAQRTPGTL